MITIRKFTLGLLLTAALGVLVLAVFLLWNYRQWQYLPDHGPYVSALDERTKVLQDRVDILTKRVGDMELLVVVLLGTSGLYAVVFVVTSYMSATSFARQADRTIANIKDQLGMAMGDLRELKEEAEQSVRHSAAGAVAAVAEALQPVAQAAPAVRVEEPKPMAVQPANVDTLATMRALVEHTLETPGGFEEKIRATGERIASWDPERLDAQQKLELMHLENGAAALELVGGPHIAAPLAGLFRSFAVLYTVNNPTRHRFYLDRALVLAPSGGPLASEIHYDLACWHAGNGEFHEAVRELAIAFKRQSRVLDERLSHDIEEGGALYQLASTPPFDKAVNDVLLNVVL